MCDVDFLGLAEEGFQSNPKSPVLCLSGWISQRTPPFTLRSDRKSLLSSLYLLYTRSNATTASTYIQQTTGNKTGHSHCLYGHTRNHTHFLLTAHIRNTHFYIMTTALAKQMEAAHIKYIPCIPCLISVIMAHKKTGRRI